MSTPPIDTPVSAFEVRCRVGQFVMDSDDPDRAPDLIAVGGTVEIEPDVRRPIRVHGENGPRVVGVDALTFTIDPATGKLVHPDGEPGVELIDPTDQHLDPQGWTYTARVRPSEGRPWEVTFGAPAEGDLVDLGGIAPVAPSPGVTENHVQQAIAARDASESFAVRAETAATEAEDYAPSFDWDGTQLVIDGETGPDLQGPAVGGIGDVPGLQAIIDRLTVGTGWRVVDWLPTGHTVNGARVLRQGSQVTLVIDATLASASNTSRTGAIPNGFRPTQAATGGGQSALLTSYNSTAPAAQMYVNSSGSVYLYGVVDGARVRQGITWQTADDWPATLPPLA